MLDTEHDCDCLILNKFNIPEEWDCSWILAWILNMSFKLDRFEDLQIGAIHDCNVWEQY